jgi:hypothetical protein
VSQVVAKNFSSTYFVAANLPRGQPVALTVVCATPARPNETATPRVAYLLLTIYGALPNTATEVATSRKIEAYRAARGVLARRYDAIMAAFGERSEDHS